MNFHSIKSLWFHRTKKPVNNYANSKRWRTLNSKRRVLNRIQYRQNLDNFEASIASEFTQKRNEVRSQRHYFRAHRRRIQVLEPTTESLRSNTVSKTIERFAEVSIILCDLSS